ncbi:MAG: sulfotransferase [Rhodothermales bacterium]
MDVHEHLQRGEQLLRDDRPDEALTLFEDLLAEHPRDVSVLTNVGIAALHSGDIQKGVDAHLHALRLDPSNKGIIENLSELVKEPAIHDYVKAYAESLRDESSHAESLRDDSPRAGGVSPDDRRCAAVLGGLTQASTPYRAAQVSVNITPQPGEDGPVLQGFTGPPRTARAVHSPLLLQLLLLEDECGSRCLIVSADLFGFDDTTVAHVRRTAREWGIPPEALLLNASHTHYAPGTCRHVTPAIGAFDASYTNKVTATIRELLPQLFERLRPCFIYATGTDARIGSNRRVEVDGRIQFGINDEGFYAEDTPILVVDHLHDGSTTAVVAHGCHPTGLGNREVISADFPGSLRAHLVEADVAHTVMFLQAAGGSAKQTRVKNGETSFTESPEGVDLNAKRLAQAVTDALRRSIRSVNGPIFARTDTIRLDFQPPPSTEVLEAMAKSDDVPLVNRQWAGRQAAIPEDERARDLSIEVQFLALGEGTCFITCPGEVVGELARYVSRHTDLPDWSAILGYSNGLKAYLPTSAMIEEGGYEAEGSAAVYDLPAPLATGLDERIAASVAQHLDRWRDVEKPNGYGRYHLSDTTGEAFFCLSSGRCGTQTLSALLGTAANARVYHHPRPYLVEETLAAYHEDIDARKTFWNARGHVLRDAWKDSLVFGELDHNMTAFASVIRQDIAEARFIVLVRNPWDFVRSGMRRGYYRGHAWDAGRLRPEPDHAEAAGWTDRTPFEKVCWLWNETYRRIREEIDRLPDDRYVIVRFEDLVEDPDVTRHLFDVLGLDGFDRDAAADILNKKLNAQKQGEFPLPSDWSDEQHAILERECRDQIRFFGYERPQSSSRPPERDEAGSRITPAHSTPDHSTPSRILFLEQDGISTGGHLDHVVEHWRSKCSATYLKTTDLTTARRAIDEADVVWLEWASPLTAKVTHEIDALSSRSVICRLHGFEVFTPYIRDINWSVVDRLVFVAEHKRDLFNRLVPAADVDQVVIRNGVTVDRFAIPPDKSNTKNLLLLGHINHRKGLPMLLQFFDALRREDPAYRLFIRGDWQDLRYKMAVETMMDELDLHSHITIVEEWIDDLDAWLVDKSHILSFSLEESFHYAVGNGMAAGLKPVIHAWRESREIWPEEFIFRNLNEFLDRMLDDSPYEPHRYRSLLTDNDLTAATQLERIDALVENVVTSRPASQLAITSMSGSMASPASASAESIADRFASRRRDAA